MRRPDPTSYVVDDPFFDEHGRFEETRNVKINAGFVQLMAATYSTQGTTSGFRYIALSDDNTAQVAADTTLTGEILAAANAGFVRALSTFAQTSGVTPWSLTISHTFTSAAGAAKSQKACLFDAPGPPPAGNMNHVLLYTERTSEIGDQLVVTFTVTWT